MSRGWLAATMSLTLFACASGAVTTSTSGATTTTSPSTTTATLSTTASISTTTTQLRPIVLAQRGISSPPLRLAADRVYVYELNVLSFELTFEESGWEAMFIGNTGMALRNETGEAPVVVGLVFKNDTTPDDVLAQISADDRTEEISENRPISLGGLNGVSIDVRVPRHPPASTGSVCTGPALGEEVGIDGVYIPATLIGCAWNRVSVMQKGSVTIIAWGADGTNFGVIGEVDVEAAELEPVLLLLDEFEAAVTFDP